MGLNPQEMPYDDEHCPACGAASATDDALEGFCSPACRDLPRCYACARSITGAPVRDDEEVSWVGREKARTWCSADCLDRSAEEYWTRRDAPGGVGPGAMRREDL